MRPSILGRALAGALVPTACAVAGPSSAWAAAPAPCNGVPQITDVAGDGHHPNEDVLGAWLTEAGGRLQAVIQIREAVWAPAHDDSDAGEFALLYGQDGQTRYVRVVARRGDQVSYDYGTFTRTGSPRFASQGTTTGSVVAGSNGYAVVDVPAVPAGTKLSSPYVLTWDGYDDVEPHWVDRAPGGVSPDESAFGADEVVGSCVPPAPVPGLPAPMATTSAVVLTAPQRVTGATSAKVNGRVVPARGGVPVTLSAQPGSTRTLTTAADGTFTTSVPLAETTQLRALAEGVSSQTATVTMRSAVTLRVRRTKAGWLLTGTTRPALPGRVLLLRTTSAKPTRTVTPTRGAFRVRLKHPRPGRYQAVYVPSGTRAERSTSSPKALR